MSGFKINRVAAWDRSWVERLRQKDASFWNGRAFSFIRHASDTDYQKQFLDPMQPQPSWSMLDVGCGSGTLAVPLAGCISSVTALDFSPSMLPVLQKAAYEGGASPMSQPSSAGRRTIGKSLCVGTYCVAVSSR